MIHSNVKNVHVLSDDDLGKVFGGDGGAPNASIVHQLGRSMEINGGAAVAVGAWVAAASVAEDATVVMLPIGITQGAAGGILAAAGGVVAYFGNLLANAPSGPLLLDLPHGRVTVDVDGPDPGWDPA